jgi:DNA-binding NarL/FixJ family response regulator
MILLLVKEDPSLSVELRRHLAPYGVSVVSYRNPLKAFDNLEETQPSIVLWDLQDYPRHWKIFIKYLREEHGKDETVFLLLSHGAPDLEEASKSLFLGVNGILPSQDNTQELARNVREVFLRYGNFEVDADSDEQDAERADRSLKPLPFLFRHPRDKHLVTGQIVRYDGRKAVFKPDFAHEVADLSEGEALCGGSLKLEESLVTLDATITRNNGQLQLAVQTVEG